MLRVTYTMFSLLLFVVFLSIGCSSNPGVAVIPDENSPVISDLPQSETAGQSNRQFLGSWQMEFDLENASGTIQPIRESMLHFNVKPYLPKPVLRNITYDPVNEVLGVDVTIKNQNPYHFDGYDVRLIIYTDTVGHLLLNDDSWTGLWDIPGGMDINPFKAFKTFPPRKLGYGAEDTQHLEIKCPGGNYFIQSAIDASWPSNCTEPYLIDNFQQDDDLYDTLGSTAGLSVDIYDWQDDVNQVVFQCPEITGQEDSQFIHSSGVTWTLDIANNVPASEGEYEAILWATSSGSGTLKLYDVVSIEVIADPCLLSVEEIIGPATITGGEIEDYSIEAVGESDISYEWSCDPESAGYFTPDDASVTFYANITDNDLNAILEVIVSASGCEPVIRTKSVLIESACPDNPPHINNIQPEYASIGSEITLTGTCFGDNPDFSSVTVGGIEVTPNQWNDTQIRFTLPELDPPDSWMNVVVEVCSIESNIKSFFYYEGCYTVRMADLPIPLLMTDGDAIGEYAYGTGGWNDATNSVYSRILKFTPSQNDWEDVGSLLTARRQHQVVSLGTKLYSLGGWNGSTISSVEYYDTDNGTRVNDYSMLRARDQFAAAVCNGKIYAFGGQDYNSAPSYFADSEVFTPGTGWSSIAPMPMSNYGHSAVTIGSDIYIVHGANSASIYVYHTTSNTWDSCYGVSGFLFYYTGAVTFAMNNCVYSLGLNSTVYRYCLNCPESETVCASQLSGYMPLESGSAQIGNVVYYWGGGWQYYKKTVKCVF